MEIKNGIIGILNSDDKIVGTGFLLGENLAITCAHVIEQAGAEPGGKVYVQFNVGGIKHVAHVDSASWSPREQFDFATLRFDNIPSGVEVLPIAYSQNCSGNDFYTFGFAPVKDIQGKGARGKIVELLRDGQQLQLRSPDPTYGMSGAPVWDETQLGIVGMITWGNRVDETVLALSSDTIRRIYPLLDIRHSCPYRGLEVFSDDHADIYFGRDRILTILLEWLQKRDFVILIGVSGSGKSSLLRAGLTKGLKKFAVPGLKERNRIVFMPGSQPVLNLIIALADKFGNQKISNIFGINQEVWSSLDGLASEKSLSWTPDEISRCIQKLAEEHEILLVIDQFERLYTECSNQELRDSFIETLLTVSNESVKVLMAIRADFYSGLMEHSGILSQVEKGVLHTTAMNNDELREVIELPAKSWGISLQPGLVERLVNDVSGRAGDLPLLQFALTELWAKDAQSGMLRNNSYDELGYSDGVNTFPGVQGAVAKRAEIIWGSLNEIEKRATRSIFLRLTKIGGVSDSYSTITSLGTSRRIWQAELDIEAQAVASKLVSVRLLTGGIDANSSQATLEMAHESLVRSWPRLGRWLEEYRPFVQWYEMTLAPFFHKWLESGCKDEYLLPIGVIREALEWEDKYPGELSGPTKEFIEKSIVISEGEQKQVRDSELLLGLYREVAVKASSQPLRDTISKICKTARFVIEADWAIIYPIKPGKSANQFELDLENLGYDGYLNSPVEALIATHPRVGGISMHVIKRGTFIIPDVYKEVAFVGGPRLSDHHFVKAEGVKALIGLAVRDPFNNEILGILYFDYLQPKKFSDTVIHQANSFANLAAIAIANIRRLDENRQRARLQTALETFEIIGADLDLEKTLSNVLSHLQNIFPHTTLCVLLYDKDDNALKFAPATLKYYTIKNPDYKNRQSFSLDKIEKGSIACKVARKALLSKAVERHHVPDVSQDPDYLALNPGTQSELCVSLMKSNGDLLGVLALERSQSAFEDDDIALVETVARQLSLAIERAQEIEQISFKESLTSMTAWAADIGYDINNEVGRIRNLAYLINATIPKNPKIQEYTALIDKSAQIISRVGPWSDLVKQAVPIDRALTTFLRELTGDRGLAVELDLHATGVSVRANPQVLKRVLRHLVRNAHRAMLDVQERRIYVATRLIEDHQVEILFKDYGIGIDEQVRANIFQIQTSTKGQRGGYGLLLTRQLIEDMGGVISLLPSSDSLGTTFAIRLPIIEKIVIDSD